MTWVRCRKCRKLLTTDESRRAGYGPDCDPHPERRRKTRIRLARRAAQGGPDLLDQLEGDDAQTSPN